VAAAPQFSTRVSLVEVYATVCGTDGPVPTLAKDDFRVEENGIPQEISVFTSGGGPLTIAVGIDRSFSIPPKQLRATVSAARQFVERLTPDDQVMVMAIGSENEVVAPLGTPRPRAADAISRIDTWGSTPLHDAVVKAIDSVQSGTGRRALVLLSDGSDRGSIASADDVVSYARRKDVLVYPVAVGRNQAPFFVELAAVTGARSFAVADDSRLPRVLETIREELRSQYLIGYESSVPAKAGETWRSIRVTTRRPGVSVRARDGYVPR
jgi:VWFA-related protein